MIKKNTVLLFFSIAFLTIGGLIGLPSQIVKAEPAVGDELPGGTHYLGYTAGRVSVTATIDGQERYFRTDDSYTFYKNTPVQVTVPQIAGYTPSRPTVTFIANDNFELSQSDSVTYLRNQDNNNSTTPGILPSDRRDDRDFSATVVVKKESIPVYSINDDKVSVTSRVMPQSSAWHAAAMKQVNGVNYYKVSSVEWLKDGDVTVRGMDVTSNGKPAIVHISLLTNKAAGAIVYALKDKLQMVDSGRRLAENTAWAANNRLKLDGYDYYQVSTNEWIRSDNMVGSY
ncbi:hypothetical protein DS831_09140 [Bombilactobacillus bombi]|uniref:Surface layer protein A domain-containing protein n=1 Tax=Bombilactobacillus bombi TaxID=1303590 RepID=A0A417ZDI4_9LACO|nr:hypothetical protein [Bombilactobacillus bombi]RHW49206.1 hypothetical protein DS831_09140 [Bombilactobacillus bombi]